MNIVRRMDVLSDEEKREIAQSVYEQAQELGQGSSWILAAVDRVVRSRTIGVLGYDPQVVDEYHPDHPDRRDLWAELIAKAHPCEFCEAPVMFIDNLAGRDGGSKLLVETTGAVPVRAVDSGDYRDAVVFPDGKGFTLASRLTADQLDDWSGDGDYCYDVELGREIPMRDPLMELLHNIGRGSDLRHSRVVAVHWDRCQPSREKRDRLSKRITHTFTAEVHDADAGSSQSRPNRFKAVDPIETE